MSTTTKPKTVALNAKVPAVKSSALPVPEPERAYRDFYDLARLAKGLMGWSKGLSKEAFREVSSDLREELAKYHAIREFYDRDELYDKDKGELTRRLHPLALDNDWEGWEGFQLKRKTVATQVAMLITSFKFAPHSPEAFAKMMIEEIIAANPSALAFEGACRELRCNKDEASIADVLAELREQESWWNKAEGAVDDLEDRLAEIETKAKG